jgi:hypothetical protein
MKNIFFIACVLFLNSTVNAQIITKSIKSQLVVRNDQGGVYENINIDLFYKFDNNYLDMKSSKGFLFVPSPFDVKSTIFQGFSVHIRPENWIYLPGQVEDGAAYKNNCSFMYTLNGYSAPVENVFETILIKYNNGESVFMIIGFDGDRSLIIRPNLPNTSY